MITLKDFVHDWFDRELRNASRILWSSTEAWPLSTDEHAFLAKAVFQLGRSMFRGEWNGQEPLENLIPVLDGRYPRQQDGVAARYAVGLLRAYRPDIDLSALNLTRDGLTLDQMDAATEAYIQYEAKEHAAAITRCVEVQQKIIEEAANGRLGTFRRRVEKGREFVAIEKSVWLSDEARLRFDHCLINETDAYSDTVVPWDVWEVLKAEVNSGRLAFLPLEILKAYPSYVFVSQSDLNALGEAVAKRSSKSAEERLPALIKQDIASLLRGLAAAWVQNGSVLTKKTTLATFVRMVTDPKSEQFLDGAKPTWAREIWEEKCPPIWKEKRGKPTDK